MLKKPLKYISLLDFIEEVKNKFLLIIFTFIIFLSISIFFHFYKDNFHAVSTKVNLLKLSSLTLKGYNLQTDARTAVKWLSESAQQKFLLINKEEKVSLRCEQVEYILDCTASGKVEGSIENLKKNMFNVIDESFIDYREYFVNLIDALIISHQELHEYVDLSGDTNIESKALYKGFVKEAQFAKKTFLAGIEESRPKFNELIVVKNKNKINIQMVLLSSLITSLFLIFIQMKRK